MAQQSTKPELFQTTYDNIKSYQECDFHIMFTCYVFQEVISSTLLVDSSFSQYMENVQSSNRSSQYRNIWQVYLESVNFMVSRVSFGLDKQLKLNFRPMK